MAKINVKTKPYKAPLRFPCINEWCAYVTVTPDDNKIIVFNKGNSKGFIDCIPIGGQFAPNSIVGDKALWKNAQKIAKKNKASDTIKSATPIFKPLCTAKVWLPRYVPSDITSLNHKLIEYITLIKDNNTIASFWNIRWNVNAALKVVFNNATLVFKGQGLGDTKWKGWDWNSLLI